MAALCVLLAALALCPRAARADGTRIFTVTGGEFHIEEARSMIDDINALRTGEDAWYWNASDTEKVYAEGLAPLRYSRALEQVAMQRAAELAMLYDHVRPNHSYGLGYSFVPSGAVSYGENIAYGMNSVGSASVVFTMWAEEDEPYAGQGHRRNMLEEGFAAVGIGYYSTEEYNFWVQEFSYYDDSDDDDVEPLSLPVSYEILDEDICAITFIQDEDRSLHPGQSIAVEEFPVLVKSKYNQNSTEGILHGAEYVSGDESILRIEDGVLTAVAEGTVQVSTTIAGFTFSAPLKVTDISMAGEFDISIEGLLYPDSNLHIQANGPEGAEYYLMRLEASEAGWILNDSYPYPSDYWFNPGSYDDYGGRCRYKLTLSAYGGGKYLGKSTTTFYVHPESEVLNLPEDLARIEGEALAGVAAGRIVIADGSRASIGSRAFADCPNLLAVRIPKGVTEIAEDAFSGCRWDMLIEAVPGSAGARYAEAHGIKCVHVIDWYTLD